MEEFEDKNRFFNKAKIKIIKNVCATCLSNDRTLFCLNDVHRTMLCILGIEMKNDQYLCWECCTMVNKIYRFQRTASSAQLVHESKSLRQLKNIGSMSRLAKTKPFTLYAIPQTNKTVRISDERQPLLPETVALFKECSELTGNSSKAKSLGIISLESCKSPRYDVPMKLHYETSSSESKVPDSDRYHTKKTKKMFLKKSRILKKRSREPSQRIYNQYLKKCNVMQQDNRPLSNKKWKMDVIDLKLDDHAKNAFINPVVTNNLSKDMPKTKEDKPHNDLDDTVCNLTSQLYTKDMESIEDKTEAVHVGLHNNDTNTKEDETHSDFDDTDCYLTSQPYTEDMQSNEDATETAYASINSINSSPIDLENIDSNTQTLFTYIDKSTCQTEQPKKEVYDTVDKEMESITKINDNIAALNHDKTIFVSNKNNNVTGTGEKFFSLVTEVENVCEIAINDKFAPLCLGKSNTGTNEIKTLCAAVEAKNVSVVKEIESACVTVITDFVPTSDIGKAITVTCDISETDDTKNVTVVEEVKNECSTITDVNVPVLEDNKLIIVPDESSNVAETDQISVVKEVKSQCLTFMHNSFDVINDSKNVTIRNESDTVIETDEDNNFTVVSEKQCDCDIVTNDTVTALNDYKSNTVLDEISNFVNVEKTTTIAVESNNFTEMECDRNISLFKVVESDCVNLIHNKFVALNDTKTITKKNSNITATENDTNITLVKSVQNDFCTLTNVNAAASNDCETTTVSNNTSNIIEAGDDKIVTVDKEVGGDCVTLMNHNVAVLNDSKTITVTNKSNIVTEIGDNKTVTVVKKVESDCVTLMDHNITVFNGSKTITVTSESYIVTEADKNKNVTIANEKQHDCNNITNDTVAATDNNSNYVSDETNNVTEAHNDKTATIDKELKSDCVALMHITFSELNEVNSLEKINNCNDITEAEKYNNVKLLKEVQNDLGSNTDVNAAALNDGKSTNVEDETSNDTHADESTVVKEVESQCVTFMQDNAAVMNGSNKVTVGNESNTVIETDEDNNVTVVNEKNCSTVTNDTFTVLNGDKINTVLDESNNITQIKSDKNISLIKVVESDCVTLIHKNFIGLNDTNTILNKSSNVTEAGRNETATTVKEVESEYVMLMHDGLALLNDSKSVTVTAESKIVAEIDENKNVAVVKDVQNDCGTMTNSYVTALNDEKCSVVSDKSITNTGANLNINIYKEVQNDFGTITNDIIAPFNYGKTRTVSDDSNNVTKTDDAKNVTEIKELHIDRVTKLNDNAAASNDCKNTNVSDLGNNVKEKSVALLKEVKSDCVTLMHDNVAILRESKTVTVSNESNNYTEADSNKDITVVKHCVAVKNIGTSNESVTIHVTGKNENVTILDLTNEHRSSLAKELESGCVHDNVTVLNYSDTTTKTCVGNVSVVDKESVSKPDTDNIVTKKDKDVSFTMIGKITNIPVAGEDINLTLMNEKKDCSLSNDFKLFNFTAENNTAFTHNSNKDNNTHMMDKYKKVKHNGKEKSAIYRYENSISSGQRFVTSKVGPDTYTEPPLISLRARTKSIKTYDRKKMVRKDAKSKTSVTQSCNAFQPVALVTSAIPLKTLNTEFTNDRLVVYYNKKTSVSQRKKKVVLNQKHVPPVKERKKSSSFPIKVIPWTESKDMENTINIPKVSDIAGRDVVDSDNSNVTLQGLKLREMTDNVMESSAKIIKRNSILRKKIMNAGDHNGNSTHAVRSFVANTLAFAENTDENTKLNQVQLPTTVNKNVESDCITSYYVLNEGFMPPETPVISDKMFFNTLEINETNIVKDTSEKYFLNTYPSVVETDNIHVSLICPEVFTLAYAENTDENTKLNQIKLSTTVNKNVESDCITSYVLNEGFMPPETPVISDKMFFNTLQMNETNIVKDTSEKYFHNTYPGVVETDNIHVSLICPEVLQISDDSSIQHNDERINEQNTNLQKYIINQENNSNVLRFALDDTLTFAEDVDRNTKPNEVQKSNTGIKKVETECSTSYSVLNKGRNKNVPVELNAVTVPGDDEKNIVTVLFKDKSMDVSWKDIIEKELSKNKRHTSTHQNITKKGKNNKVTRSSGDKPVTELRKYQIISAENSVLKNDDNSCNVQNSTKNFPMTTNGSIDALKYHANEIIESFLQQSNNKATLQDKGRNKNKACCSLFPDKKYMNPKAPNPNYNKKNIENLSNETAKKVQELLVTRVTAEGTSRSSFKINLPVENGTDIPIPINLIEKDNINRTETRPIKNIYTDKTPVSNIKKGRSKTITSKKTVAKASKKVNSRIDSSMSPDMIVLWDHCYCMTNTSMNTIFKQTKLTTIAKEAPNNLRYKIVQKATGKISFLKSDPKKTDNVIQSCGVQEIVDDFEKEEAVANTVYGLENNYLNTGVRKSTIRTGKYNYNAINGNYMEEANDYAILTDIKIEEYNSESVENKNQSDNDFDWCIQSFSDKTKQKKTYLKQVNEIRKACTNGNMESEIDSVDHSTTDTGSEFEAIDKEYEANDYYDQNEFIDNSNSQPSYNYYQIKPSEYDNYKEPRHYDNDSFEIEASKEDPTDLEMYNNITVSFSSSLFADNPNNTSTESIDEVKHDLTATEENVLNSDTRNTSPDLLEPIFFTPWKDSTYDHVLADNLNESSQYIKNNESNKFTNNKRKRKRSSSVKEKLADEATLCENKKMGNSSKRLKKNSTEDINEETGEAALCENKEVGICSKRLKKNSTEDKIEETDEAALCENKKIDICSKRLKENSTKDKKEEKVSECEKYEKLLQRPIVVLENILDLLSDGERAFGEDIIKLKDPKRDPNNANTLLKLLTDKNKTTNVSDEMNVDGGITFGDIRNINKLSGSATRDSINKGREKKDLSAKINTRAKSRNKKLVVKPDTKNRDQVVKSAIDHFRMITKRRNINTNEDVSLPSDFDNFTLRLLEDCEIETIRQKFLNEVEYKNAKYKCHKCVLILRQGKGIIEKHLKKYHKISAGRFICNICECRFKDENQFRFHTESHKSVYKCRSCSKEFLYHHNILNHVKHTHQNRRKKYMCKICKKKYFYHGSLRSHERRHKIKNTNTTDGKLRKTKISLSLTDNNLSSTDNIRLNDNNLNLNDNNLSLNDNNVSLNDNNVSLNDNNVSLNGNNVSLNNNNVSLNDNNVSLNDNNVSLNDNNASLNDNNVCLNDNNLGLNDNNLCLNDKNLNLSDNNLSLTDNNLKLTDIDLSLSNSKLMVTDNNLSSMDNGLSLTDNKIDSSLTTRTLYTCDLCHMECDFRSSLRRHKIMHHKKNNKSTTLIENNFSLTGREKKACSDKKKHRRKLYPCELCPKEYRFLSSLRNHRIMHQNTKNANKSTTLTENNLSLTGRDNNGCSDKKKRGRIFKCEECHGHYRSSDSLMKHRRRIHKTGNNSKTMTLTDNNLNLAHNNLSLNDNNISLTDNNLSLTDNNLSLTDNNISLTDNNLSLTYNNLSLTDNDISLTDNNLSLTSTANELHSDIRKRRRSSQLTCTVRPKKNKSQVRSLRHQKLTRETDETKKNIKLIDPSLTNYVTTAYDHNLSLPENSLSKKNKKQRHSEAENFSGAFTNFVHSILRDSAQEKRHFKQALYKKTNRMTVKRPSYTCEICYKDYPNAKSLRIHRSRLHKRKIDQGAIKENTNKIISLTDNNSIIDNNLSLNDNNLRNNDNNLSLNDNNLRNNNKTLSLSGNNLSNNDSNSSLSVGKLTIPVNVEQRHLETKEIERSTLYGNPLSLTDTVKVTNSVKIRSKRIFECEECHGHYRSSASLMKHRRRIHKTGNNSKTMTLTDNNLNLAHNNLSLTDNNISLTDNNLSLTDNNLSLTDNNISLTDNNLSLTDNNLSLTDNDISLTDNNLSLTDNNLSLTDNDISLTDNNLSLTGTANELHSDIRKRKRYSLHTCTVCPKKNKSQVRSLRHQRLTRETDETEKNVNLTDPSLTNNVTANDDNLSLPENSLNGIENHKQIHSETESNSVLFKHFVMVKQRLCERTERKIKCKICKKSFKSPGALAAHTKHKHTTDNEAAKTASTDTDLSFNFRNLSLTDNCNK